jgi:hypothetical protein
MRVVLLLVLCVLVAACQTSRHWTAADYANQTFNKGGDGGGNR